MQCTLNFLILQKIVLSMALVQTESQSPVFALCDECRWCATYFDKNKLPGKNRCPSCHTDKNELCILSIMPNESITFNRDDKRGVELKFMNQY